MRTITDIEKMLNDCKKELETIGVSCDNNIILSIAERSNTRVLGQCRYKRVSYGSPYFNCTISINPIFLSDEVDEMSAKQTIMHELIHACFPADKHTGRWKETAEKISRKFGYNITRTTALNTLLSDEMTKEYYEEYYKNAKYVYKCKDCGNVVIQKRKSKFTEHPEKYHCGHCKGKFERVYDYQGEIENKIKELVNQNR